MTVDTNEGVYVGPDGSAEFDFQWFVDRKLLHSLHTSERRSFRGCRRRWNWIFREYWYPQVQAKPLDFGVAYHYAMEQIYNPATWFTLTAEEKLQKAKEAFIEKTQEQLRNYESATKSGADQEVLDDFEERSKLGLGMLEYYAANLLPYEIEMIPVKVEVAFEVPIVNPDTGKQLWCKCADCWRRFKRWVLEENDGTFYNETNSVVNLGPDLDKHGDIYWSRWQGLPVAYGGRIDVLVQDADGRYWILDWKTAARLSGDRDEYLLLDDQITSYVWAMWMCGLRVAGFLYHEQKKAFPEPPEPNKVRRLGRLYSVSKSLNTSAELYEETVKENDPFAYEQGLYDDFIEYLRTQGSLFHHRAKVYRSQAELVSAGRNIYYEALDMTDPNLRVYPNAGRFSCGGCAFRQPCLGMNANEDYTFTLESMFVKRRRHYWEEVEASTDGKAGQ